MRYAVDRWAPRWGNLWKELMEYPGKSWDGCTTFKYRIGGNGI